MSRREGGSAGPMNTIITGFVGLLVIVAIVILGPVQKSQFRTGLSRHA